MGDDAEIRSLLARLAQLTDDGTVEDYLGLFAPDAVWEMPANPAVGVPADRRAGVAEVEAGVRGRRAAGVQGPGSATRHVVTTIAVDLRGGDRATSVAYWMFLADTTGTPRVVSAGRYDDELRRIDGRWLLGHRRITVG